MAGDGSQRPVIDPTANVLALVKAAMERQDDLRDAERRRIDELRKQQNEFEHEIRKVRAESATLLSAAESRRIDALAMAESRRLDAVLVEQKSAVALANEKNAATAATLAASVVASAEALRTQVSTTTANLEKRLTEVERKQYEAAGQAAQRVEGRQGIQWSLGFIVGAVGVVIAVAALASRFLVR
jgi:hypothetical protein